MDQLLLELQQTFISALILSLIPLGASMLVGVVLGVVQAATQVQEQSLVFMAKLVAAALAVYFSQEVWLAIVQESVVRAFAR